MQQIEGAPELPPDTVEFRKHLQRLSWDPGDFARAAKIKPRTATIIYRGEQRCPDSLMAWLRHMATCADQVPQAPAR